MNYLTEKILPLILLLCFVFMAWCHLEVLEVIKNQERQLEYYNKMSFKQTNGQLDQKELQLYKDMFKECLK